MWHVKPPSGSVQGPFSAVTLRGKIERGDVSLESTFRLVGSGVWIGIESWLDVDEGNNSLFPPDHEPVDSVPTNPLIRSFENKVDGSTTVIHRLNEIPTLVQTDDYNGIHVCIDGVKWIHAGTSKRPLAAISIRPEDGHFIGIEIQGRQHNSVSILVVLDKTDPAVYISRSRLSYDRTLTDISIKALCYSTCMVPGANRLYGIIEHSPNYHLWHTDSICYIDDIKSSIYPILATGCNDIDALASPFEALGPNLDVAFLFWSRSVGLHRVHWFGNNAIEAVHVENESLKPESRRNRRLSSLSFNKDGVLFGAAGDEFLSFGIPDVIKTSSYTGSSNISRRDNALGTVFHSELELKETNHEDVCIHFAEDPEDAFEDIQNDDEDAYAEKRGPYGEAHANKSDRQVKTIVKTHNRVVQTDQKQIRTSEKHRQVPPLKRIRRKETAGLKLEGHNGQAQKTAPVSESTHEKVSATQSQSVSQFHTSVQPNTYPNYMHGVQWDYLFAERERRLQAESCAWQWMQHYFYAQMDLNRHQQARDREDQQYLISIALDRIANNQNVKTFARGPVEWKQHVASKTLSSAERIVYNSPLPNNDCSASVIYEGADAFTGIETSMDTSVSSPLRRMRGRRESMLRNKANRRQTSVGKLLVHENEADGVSMLAHENTTYGDSFHDFTSNVNGRIPRKHLLMLGSGLHRCSISGSRETSTTITGQLYLFDPNTNETKRVGRPSLGLSAIACTSLGQCFGIQGSSLVKLDPSVGNILVLSQLFVKDRPNFSISITTITFGMWLEKGESLYGILEGGRHGHSDAVVHIDIGSGSCEIIAETHKSRVTALVAPPLSGGPWGGTIFYFWAQEQGLFSMKWANRQFSVDAVIVGPKAIAGIRSLSFDDQNMLYGFGSSMWIVDTNRQQIDRMKSLTLATKCAVFISADV